MNKAILVAFPLLAVLLAAGGKGASEPDLPLLLQEDFSQGAQRWAPTDPEAWKVISEGSRPLYSLFQQSRYEPPVRSPRNLSLLQDLWVSDFVLEARVRSTSREYGHRDLCFFFGHQDPSHFYYVHLASQADPHAHSIFLVNGAPRVSIASRRTEGVRWIDHHFHTVRIERRLQEGSIRVFFDDLSEPVMEAVDSTFGPGRVGIGSFDDTGDFQEIRLWGIQVEPPSR